MLRPSRGLCFTCPVLSSTSGPVVLAVAAVLLLTGCPIGPGGERGEALLYSVSPKSGHPDDTITIVGINLDLIDAITFGNATATGYTKPATPVGTAYLEPVDVMIPALASSGPIQIWRNGNVTSSLPFTVLTTEVKENEASQTFANAPLVLSGQYASGSIAGSDFDYFKLKTDTTWATTFELDVENKGMIPLEASFRVKEDLGLMPFVIDPGDTVRAWFTLKGEFLNPQGQKRTVNLGVRVRAASTVVGDSDYEVRVASFPVDDVYEPNDKPGAAQSMTPTGPKTINGFDYWDYSAINTFLTSAYDAGPDTSVGLTDGFEFPVFAGSEPAMYSCSVFALFLWLNAAPIELQVTDDAGNNVPLVNPIGSGPYGQFTVPANTPLATYRLTVTTLNGEEAISGFGSVDAPPYDGDSPSRARQPVIVNVSRDPVTP